MIIQKMLKRQEKQIKETIKNPKKSFNNIFDILEYYVFNQNKLEDKEIINHNVQHFSSILMNKIENLKEFMSENCLKDSNQHDYINRLELIIKFLPKYIDKTTLIDVKDLLEEDFERVPEYL